MRRDLLISTLIGVRRLGDSDFRSQRCVARIGRVGFTAFVVLEVLLVVIKARYRRTISRHQIIYVGSYARLEMPASGRTIACEHAIGKLNKRSIRLCN